MMDETNPHSLYSIPQSHNPLMPESVVLCLECLINPIWVKERSRLISQSFCLLCVSAVRLCVLYKSGFFSLSSKYNIWYPLFPIHHCVYHTSHSDGKVTP